MNSPLARLRIAGAILVLIFVGFLIFGRHGMRRQHGPIWTDIEPRIRSYIGTKTLLSALTGVLADDLARPLRGTCYPDDFLSEAAKVLARQMVAAYQKEGRLPELTPTLQSNGLTVYSDVEAKTPVEALQNFLHQAQSGAYISLQAYVQPTAETDEALLAFRTRLRDQSRLATTIGYGPRFLHSTGQLHKGDAGKGLFIQLTANTAQDAGIPDEAGRPESMMTFGVLKTAQALGDRQALLDNGRQVIRFHLSGDVPEQLKQLAEAK